MKTLGEFLNDVEREVRRARGLFPDPTGSMTALTEEVGELAKALLDESPARIYAEAMQVACVAARVATEGDPSLSSYRVARARRQCDKIMRNAEMIRAVEPNE